MKKLTFALVFLVLSIITMAQKTKSFEVKVVGKGKPILLIPGYSCSGEVWNETAEHLKDKYELHILTLAGFGGVAPIQEGEVLKTVRTDIIQYVKDKKMHKPMIIGHSLGAFMTLWLHSTEPELFGKSICVDGLPFISAVGNPSANADTLKKQPQYNKEAVINNFKSLPSEHYVENTAKSLIYQVSDTLRAKQIAVWSFKSDRTTLGSTIVEMTTTDLRQELAKIKENILVLTSWWGSQEASEKEYNAQYALLKNKTIKVSKGKHFIMYDTPEWFYNEIDLFLDKKK